MLDRESLAHRSRTPRSSTVDRQRLVEIVGLITLAGVLLGGFVARDWWLARSEMPLFTAAAPLDRLTGPEPASDPATASPVAIGPAGSPTACWVFRTGGLIAEAPAIGGGAVYVGSWDGSAYALDTASGALRWRVPTGHRLDAAPVAAGGSVYIASTGGFVAALDAATGGELWRVVTVSKPAAAPIVVDGTLFVVSGGDGSRPAVAAGTVYAAGGGDDRRLHAVDAATGIDRWSARLDRNGVYAFDAVTGLGRWYLDTARPVRSSPVVDGDAVYAADGLIYRIDAKTGALRWQIRPSMPAPTALAVASPLLLVTGDDGPAVLDGMGRVRGWLAAVDAATGDERWRVQIGGPALSAPVAAGGVAYIGGDDGNVYAVETATGREHWRIPLGERLSTTALAGGVVYVGGSGGSVFALGDGCGEPAGDRSGGRSRLTGRLNLVPMWSTSLYGSARGQGEKQ